MVAINGFSASVSGLQAAYRQLGQSAHNLANSNTTGFIPRRAEQTTGPAGGVRAGGRSMGRPASAAAGTSAGGR